jgi:hypothetical protein
MAAGKQRCWYGKDSLCSAASVLRSFREAALHPAAGHSNDSCAAAEELSHVPQAVPIVQAGRDALHHSSRRKLGSAAKAEFFRCLAGRLRNGRNLNTRLRPRRGQHRRTDGLRSASARTGTPGLTKAEKFGSRPCGFRLDSRRHKTIGTVRHPYRMDRNWGWSGISEAARQGCGTCNYLTWACDTSPSRINSKSRGIRRPFRSPRRGAQECSRG